MCEKKHITLICLFLTAATVIAFWQVNRCDFVYLDDREYMTENVHVQAGLTIEGVLWAFTTGDAANWHPLTWISHMADVQLFGLAPRWHHLMNLLFHVANTVLLFLVLHYMTKAPWRSAFVAALFALHPLHVESVAWVSERKDVLSTFFWMLTTGAYAYYTRHRGTGAYLAVLMLFCLGLMAKPMLVTLPFVLLLLDYWPLGRILAEKSAPEPNVTSVSRTEKKRRSSRTPEKAVSWQTGVRTVREFPWYLLLEKVPLFALAAVSCIVTYMVQDKGKAVVSSQIFPLCTRITNALVSYVVYIKKMLQPAGLAAFYPHPLTVPVWQVAGAVVMLGAITFLVVLKGKKFPYLPLGWFWYAGTLIPVIGLVQVGGQAMADRYTYVPLIGLFVIVAWLVPDLTQVLRYRAQVLAISSFSVLSCLFILTWIQVGYWRTSFTLFDHTLEVTSRNGTIYFYRGIAYYKLGDYRRAIEDHDRGLEIIPDNALAHARRGMAYANLGDHMHAIHDFNKAIELNPGDAETYCNRGASRDRVGNHSLAISDFDKAIEIKPDYAKAYFDRGIAYGNLDNLPLAIHDFSKAIQIDPDFTAAYNNRAIAYAETGKLALAIADLDKLIAMNPENASAYCNRGITYDAMGKHDLAISDFDRVIGINPNSAEAFFNRGLALENLGENTRALQDIKTSANLGYENAKEYLKSKGRN